MPSRRSHRYAIAGILPRAAVFAGLLAACASASAVTLAEKAKESGCVNRPMWLAGDTYRCATQSGVYTRNERYTHTKIKNKNKNLFYELPDRRGTARAGRTRGKDRRDSASAIAGARTPAVAGADLRRAHGIESVVTATEIAHYDNREPLLFANRRKFRLTTFRAASGDLTSQVSSALQQVSRSTRCAASSMPCIKYETHSPSHPGNCRWRSFRPSPRPASAICSSIRARTAACCSCR